MAKEPTEKPSSEDIQLATLRALEAIAARMDAIRSTDADPDVLGRLASAFEGLTQAQKDIAQGQNATLKQIHVPENKNVPKISVFNLRGDKDHPRPALKCEFYIPYPATADALTREECELMNLIEPGEYKIKRTDGTTFLLQVKAERGLDSETINKMNFIHPSAFNVERHQQMPALADLVRQILKSKPHTHTKALDVLTMEEEEVLILKGLLNNGQAPVEGQVLISVGA